MYFTGFVCIECGAVYPPDRDLSLCPACDNLLDAQYDYARLARVVDGLEAVVMDLADGV